MADEKIFTARFKVEDDGSITLDKISGKLVDVGKKGQEGLGKISSSLSLIKLDSIINLGERAFHTGERIYNMARQVASSTMEIEKNSRIAGLSTDIYQKMAYAAKMTDVDMESLSKGMKILAGHMDDVRKGGGQAIGLFESIGISVKDSSGGLKSFDSILGDLSDRFKRMPDGVEKVALAVDLFGKSGQNLIPFLNQGKSGIEALYKEAERLGIVLDESLIKKGSELEDKFKRVEAAASAFFKKVVVGAYSAVDAMATYAKSQEEFLKWSEASLSYLPGKGPAGLAAPIGTQKDPWAQQEKASTYLRQSEAALKAIKEANEKILEQNYKLSDLYDYEANVLKGMAKVREGEARSMEIMAELGIKTEAGAKKEIEAIEEKFKTLMGKGFKPEEIEQARAKLEEQLKAVAEKYAKPSGWQLMAEGEGEVKVWSNIRAEAGGIEEKIKAANEELNRMAINAEKLSQTTNKVMIDASSFDNANSAIDTLRIKLESMTEKDWIVNITITGTGSSALPIMEKIQEIYNGLSSLPESLRGLAVDISMKDITQEIYALQAQMANIATAAGPKFWVPGAWSKWQLSMMQPQLQNLQTMQQILQAYQGQAGGEGGRDNLAGGISINIGTINVSGEASAEIAEQLDEQLAILWEKNRSKLKQAIQL